MTVKQVLTIAAAILAAIIANRYLQVDRLTAGLLPPGQ